MNPPRLILFANDLSSGGDHVNVTADLWARRPRPNGTEGRTGLRRMLLGSTAEQILRDASCPVMVVRLHSKEKTFEERS